MNSDGGIAVAVRVTPGAREERVGGAWKGPDGASRLCVSVRAPAHEGEANAAVTAVLAAAFGAPKSAVSLKSGGAGRLKLFHVRGDAQHLGDRLGVLLEAGKD